MRKIIYVLFLAATVVLVSFRGGSIAYLLFYFALMLPVLAVLYSIYVYCRFRIVQEVPRIAVKGEELSYRLILANEDLIPFLNIKLFFYEDLVRITEVDGTDTLCLLPKQRTGVDTKMYCKYRGTYPVGVKSVSITDFLGLFTITYPMMSQIRLTARPRILPLELLLVHMQEQDPKMQLFSLARLQELPDYELRSFYAGDPLKYIHWKSSARTGELLVRKQMPEEMFETVIIMDLFPISGDPLERRQKEDNIVEAAIAFIHDYYLKNISIRIVFMNDKINETLIDARSGFDHFYDTCAGLPFEAVLPVEKVFAEYAAHAGNDCSYILITASGSASLQHTVEEFRRLGKEILLIPTGELSL